MVSSARGTGRIDDSAGGMSRMMAVSTSTGESPPNARSPLTISWMMAPRANWSVRKSAAAPRHCSGDM